MNSVYEIAEIFSSSGCPFDLYLRLHECLAIYPSDIDRRRGILHPACNDCKECVQAFRGTGSTCAASRFLAVLIFAVSLLSSSCIMRFHSVFARASVLLAVVVLGILWLIHSKQMSTSLKREEASAPLGVGLREPNRATVPKLPASSAIAPPVVPLLPQPESAAVAAAQTPSSALAADPRASLKTTLSDIAQLTRTGDAVLYYLTYTPPDQFDPDRITQIQKMQQQEALTASRIPQGLEMLQQNREKSAQSYEALMEQTPTFDSTGDEATYIRTVNLPYGTMQTPLILVKMNGKWYVKQEARGGQLSISPRK